MTTINSLGIRPKRVRTGTHAGEYRAKAYGMWWYGRNPIDLIAKIKSR